MAGSQWFITAGIAALTHAVGTYDLVFFVRYNPRWRTEPPKETGRVIEEQMEKMEVA